MAILLYLLGRTSFPFTVKRFDFNWLSSGHCTLSTNENPAYISCKMAPPTTILLYLLGRTTFLFTAKKSDLKWLSYGHCTLSTNENPAYISCKMAPHTTFLLYSSGRTTFLFTAKRSDVKWPSYGHCTLATNEKPGPSEQTLVILYSQLVILYSPPSGSYKRVINSLRLSVANKMPCVKSSIFMISNIAQPIQIESFRCKKESSSTL